MARYRMRLGSAPRGFRRKRGKAVVVGAVALTPPGPFVLWLLQVLLPTYNEKENLPLIVWLLIRSFTNDAGLKE